VKASIKENIDQFLAFGKVWEAVPPMAGLSRARGILIQLYPGRLESAASKIFATLKYCLKD
jgi:hypothetical protein